MQTPENMPADRLLGAIGHMAEASGLAYQLTQELAHLTHELAPLTGGPLEPVCAADKAYAHVLAALTSAHRIIRDISAVASAFDTVLAADDIPALTLVGGE